MINNKSGEVKLILLKQKKLWAQKGKMNWQNFIAERLSSCGSSSGTNINLISRSFIGIKCRVFAVIR